ncbi:DUF5994 family protein [Streptomyces sp. NPDC050534]|uniref:DUF5994 family protein n=1 Tax=Streptomyces sp. NPDC050534 TaxID=3365625 RepID=UPI0037995C69
MEPTADRSARLSSPLPVRLSLAPYEGVPGGLDGAWWPYSRDLVEELPLLVEAMDGVGTITRVILGIQLWPRIPHQIAVGRGYVTAGWSVTGQEQNVISLCSYRDGFRTLLVIPPTAAADTADWLMNSPVPVDGSRTATELLAIAAARSSATSADDPL